MRLENFTNPLKVLHTRREKQEKPTTKDRLLAVHAGFVDLGKAFASAGRSLRALVASPFSRNHDLGEATFHIVSSAEKTAIGVKSIARGVFQPREVLEEHESWGLFTPPQPKVEVSADPNTQPKEWYQEKLQTLRPDQHIEDEVMSVYNSSVAPDNQIDSVDTFNSVASDLDKMEALVQTLRGAALIHYPGLDMETINDIIEETATSYLSDPLITVEHFIEDTLERFILDQNYQQMDPEDKDAMLASLRSQILDQFPTLEDDDVTIILGELVSAYQYASNLTVRDFIEDAFLGCQDFAHPMGVDELESFEKEREYQSLVNPDNLARIRELMPQVQELMPQLTNETVIALVADEFLNSSPGRTDYPSPNTIAIRLSIYFPQFSKVEEKRVIPKYKEALIQAAMELQPNITRETARKIIDDTFGERAKSSGTVYDCMTEALERCLAYTGD